MRNLKYNLSMLSLALVSILFVGVLAEETPGTWQGTIKSSEGKGLVGFSEKDPNTNKTIKYNCGAVLTVKDRNYDLLADGDLAERIWSFALQGASAEIIGSRIHVDIKGVETPNGIKVSSITDLEMDKSIQDEPSKAKEPSEIVEKYLATKWVVYYFKKRPKIKWHEDGHPSIDAKPDFTETLSVGEICELADKKTEAPEPDPNRRTYAAINILKDAFELDAAFDLSGVKFLSAQIISAAKEDADKRGEKFDGDANIRIVSYHTFHEKRAGIIVMPPVDEKYRDLHRVGFGFQILSSLNKLPPECLVMTDNYYPDISIINQFAFCRDAVKEKYEKIKKTEKAK